MSWYIYSILYDDLQIRLCALFLIHQGESGWKCTHCCQSYVNVIELTFAPEGSVGFCGKLNSKQSFWWSESWLLINMARLPSPDTENKPKVTAAVMKRGLWMINKDHLMAPPN